MTVFTTTPDVDGLLPDDHGALIVKPVQRESIAIKASNVVVTGSTTFHIPVVAEDPEAGWYAEGEDMLGDDTKFETITVTPAKVGHVQKISNELADDSSPEASSVVGDSMGRAIASKVDAAYLGNLAAPAAPGLESIAATVSTVDAGAAWADLDAFAEAISKSEEHGGTLAYFIAHPSDALELMRIRKQVDSNEPLLGNDATSATSRSILGVQLLTSPHATPGTVWGIDPRFSTLVMRKDVEVQSSREAYFSSDITAIKATMRVGFAFSNPQALVKITTA